MEWATPERSSCAYCGLPVHAAGAAAPIFCCPACRMVAAVVGGRGEASHSWELLRLGVGALLAMNVMMVSLLLYSGSVEPATVPVFHGVLLALAAPALAILLPPFLRGAAREAAGRRASVDALICIGSLAAFGVSLGSTVRGAGPVYFDTATMLPVLVTVGKMLEAGGKSRAAQLLHALETLLPEKALRLDETGAHEVPLPELKAGDRLRVRPGERIAVDGRIMEGTSVIEEAAFTGEYLPRLCREGDQVRAGTVNGAGPLVVLAERVGADVLLQGMVDMVQDAWRHPSRAQRIAERAAAFFTPLVLLTAAGTLVCWSVAGEAGQGGLSALAVLVVACPCTMGIATPLATALAIARAARAGVVVRGGRVMEELGRTEVLFIDKTGTVTVGHPTLEEVLLYDVATSEEELLGRVAVLESASEHPLGAAIVAEAARRGIADGVVRDAQVRPGRGMSGTVEWKGSQKRVTVASACLLQEAGSETGMSAVDVAWDGEVRGRLLFVDAVHPAAADSVSNLRRLGVRTVLLSGDRLGAARAVAEDIGIEHTEAPRTPAQKVAAIRAEAASGKRVAMVGDGINDAPALAEAHTGIAIGAGSELARHAADVVLLADTLVQVPWIIQLSRRTRGIIRGNFAWSFGYNAIALAAAASGVLHPLLAALAMVLSSLTVLGNSLRIAAFPEPDAACCSGDRRDPSAVATEGAPADG